MLAIIGLVLNGIALVLNIVGVAIPYWFYQAMTVQDVGTVSAKFGLWKTCVDAPPPVGTECKSFEDTFLSNPGTSMPTEVEATRGLEIVAILLTAVAGGLLCLKLFVRKDNKRLLQVAGVIAAAAGVLMIIGAIVFVADNTFVHQMEALDPDVDLKPHAGFALCIVSGILSFAAAVLYIADDRWNPAIPLFHNRQ